MPYPDAGLFPLVLLGASFSLTVGCAASASMHTAQHTRPGFFSCRCHFLLVHLVFPPSGMFNLTKLNAFSTIIRWLKYKHRLSQVLLQEHEVPVCATHASSSQSQSGKPEPSGKHAHSAPPSNSPHLANSPCMHVPTLCTTDTKPTHSCYFCLTLWLNCIRVQQWGFGVHSYLAIAG